MSMIYTSKRGKTIEFDDFQDNTEEYKSYWVEMCPHCHNKHKAILGNRASIGAMGTCSVDGCENEAQYYVDFDMKEVSFEKPIELTQDQIYIMKDDAYLIDSGILDRAIARCKSI